MDYLLTVTFATPDAARVALHHFRPARMPPRWRTLASSRAICVGPFTSTSWTADRRPVLAGPDRRTRPRRRARRRQRDRRLAGRLCPPGSAALQPGRSAVLALTNGIEITPARDPGPARAIDPLRSRRWWRRGPARADRAPSGRSAGFAAIGLRQLPVAAGRPAAEACQWRARRLPVAAEQPPSRTGRSMRKASTPSHPRSLLLLAACSAGAQQQSRGVKAGRAAAPVGDELKGTSWQAVSLDGAAVANPARMTLSSCPRAIRSPVRRVATTSRGHSPRAPTRSPWACSGRARYPAPSPRPRRSSS